MSLPLPVTTARLTVRPYVDADDTSLSLAVVRTDDGSYLGEVTIFPVSTANRSGEIGFVLHPDVHGRGYATEAATEAATELLRMGFDHLGLHRMIGRCDARNTASAALMRRPGMRQEAHFVQNEWVKDEWADELVFAMLASEWRAGDGAASGPVTT